MLRVATHPVMEREACFLGNEDLGQLSTASTSLYKVVSIALTIWAIWEPTLSMWVGSSSALDRSFAVDCLEESHEGVVHILS